jgi:hypothetical protein
MNTTFKNILIFAAGTAVGGFGSYVYTKNIYEKILEEETSLMKEDLKEKLQQTKEKIIKDC